MILHTLNASVEDAVFEDCLALLAEGDALLLLGDGVYAAMAGTEAAGRLQRSQAALHVLENDAIARGVNTLLCTGATRVDMDGFVALTERFERIQAWY